MDSFIDCACALCGRSLATFSRACSALTIILFSVTLSGSAADVVHPRLPGGNTCVRYAGAERLREITRDRWLSGNVGGFWGERTTFVIIMLLLRSPSTSVGVTLYSEKPRDFRNLEAGDDWGRSFSFCSLCAFKILCTCTFILFKVLSWCLIRGGALEILCDETLGGANVDIIFRSHVGVFAREGGREGRLSLVSARISLCARTWQRASLRGGVFA